MGGAALVIGLFLLIAGLLSESGKKSANRRTYLEQQAAEKAAKEGRVEASSELKDMVLQDIREEFDEEIRLHELLGGNPARDKVKYPDDIFEYLVAVGSCSEAAAQFRLELASLELCNRGYLPSPFNYIRPDKPYPVVYEELKNHENFLWMYGEKVKAYKETGKLYY